MSFTKRPPQEFGVIIPKENGINWVKQGGGMTCAQRTLEGVYIPLGEPTYRVGYPDWKPEGPNFTQKLRRINLKEDIPQEDFETMPPKVRRRGNFDGYDEYSQWIDNHEQYGRVNLHEELRRFTYGLFDNLSSDPRNRWDGTEELWGAIREKFGFEFEFVDYEDYVHNDEFADYPNPEAAIRPIRLEGSKEHRGRLKEEWAEELEGEIVFLLCPNAD